MNRVEALILPTLPAQAGMSMRLYNGELLAGLEGVSDVNARVAWPPFACPSSAGWFTHHWIRYVRYVQWCRRLQADVFHIADHSNSQLLITLPAHRTVVTCHDLYPVAVALGRVRFSGVEPRRSMWPTALRLSLLRRAAAIVAISRHTAEECRRCFGIERKRLYVGYHGVSSRFFSNDGRDALELFRRQCLLPSERIHILHVGSNDPRKNLRTVFRVVARLRDKLGTNVCLVKVGTRFGPRENKMIQELGLTRAIRDLGTLSDEQTALAYRAATVLLYPSFHEGMCRPAVEAMASGTPVVASHRGAIPELLEDSRLLFDPEDVDGMARRIIQIGESSDLRAEIAERGKRAAQKFTWQAHGAAVAEAYRAVTSRWV